MVHDGDPTSTLNVIVHNDPHVNSNSTVKRTLEINADDKKIELKQKDGDLFVVFVDGKFTSLPYNGVPKIKQVC